MWDKRAEPQWRVVGSGEDSFFYRTWVTGLLWNFIDKGDFFHSCPHGQKVACRRLTLVELMDCKCREIGPPLYVCPALCNMAWSLIYSSVHVSESISSHEAFNGLSHFISSEPDSISLKVQREFIFKLHLENPLLFFY